MPVISREDYISLIYEGVLIPNGWFDLADEITYAHDKPQILVESPFDNFPASEKFKHVNLDSLTKELIITNSPRPANWSLQVACDLGILHSAAKILTNLGFEPKHQLGNIVQDIHEAFSEREILTLEQLFPSINISSFQDFSEWDWRSKFGKQALKDIESVVSEARIRSGAEHYIASDAYSLEDGRINPLTTIHPFGPFIACGTAVMFAALSDKLEGRWCGGRIARWSVSFEEMAESRSRFHDTPYLSKTTGISPTHLDQLLEAHFQITSGGLKGPTPPYKLRGVLALFWTLRSCYPTRLEYSNLASPTLHSFLLDHGLDVLGLIDMHGLMVKLAGMVKLEVGVRAFGIMCAGLKYNNMKASLEREIAGGGEVRIIYRSRLEMLSANMCDSSTLQVLFFHPFDKNLFNDLSFVGVIADHVDVGEDAEEGEICQGFSSWSDILDAHSVRIYVRDIARIFNEIVIKRPDTAVALAAATVPPWLSMNGRHHTLARAFLYLRHASLGPIDGTTNFFDLFDETLTYQGKYDPKGKLPEVDAGTLLQEVGSSGWEFTKLKSLGLIAKSLSEGVEKIRSSGSVRVLESVILLIRWFIYAPRVIRQEVDDVALSKRISLRCYDVEEELLKAFLVLSLWMKFDDRPHQIIAALSWHYFSREMLAEAAALYSLDSYLSKKNVDLDSK